MILFVSPGWGNGSGKGEDHDKNDKTDVNYYKFPH